jgi:hypothetical protein
MDRLAVDRGEGPGLAESVWRYRFLVALVVLLSVLGAWVWSTRQPVQYEAITLLHLKDPTAGQLFPQNDAAAIDLNRYVRNQSALIASPAVLDRAARLVNSRVSSKQLARQVTTEPSKDADIITVRVRDHTAPGAAQLANAVGRSYEQVAVRLSGTATNDAIKQLRATGVTLAQRLDALEDGIRSAPQDQALKAERIAVADQLTRVEERKAELTAESEGSNPVAMRVPAEPPEQPVQPRPLLLMAGGALLGFAVAGSLAWRLNWRRQDAEEDSATGSSLERWRELSPWTSRAGRRAHKVAMSTNGSPTGEDGHKDQVTTLWDFELMASSVQQLFQSLDGPRQRLYEQNIPQLVAEEIAHRFPVDQVVVALQLNDELPVLGSVGLKISQLHTSDHELERLIDEAVRSGPRVLGDDESARLAVDGLGVRIQTEALVLVPIVRQPVGFGVLLAGRRPSSESAVAPLSDPEVEGIATCTEDVTDYLWAWLLVRTLKLRLAALP